VTERDYSHRDIVDKLGIKPGHAVTFGSVRGYVDDLLRDRILERIGRPFAEEDEPCDVVLVDVDEQSDAIAELTRWQPRLKPNGGIWLLTRKRGQLGYVDQRELIAAGGTAGVVDNKICSVSDTISAMRFVIRRVDRAGKMQQ
jgi:hypothetical protein